MLLTPRQMFYLRKFYHERFTRDASNEKAPKSVCRLINGSKFEGSEKSMHENFHFISKSAIKPFNLLYDIAD